jgi:hypothetical protein
MNAKSPPKYAAIKRIALALPGASEVYHNGPWFNVGKKTFVCHPVQHARWIFKLPKDRQMLYFEVRPETFAPMRAGALLWSFVRVENIDAVELRDLVTAAWRTVAPKKLQADLASPRKRQGARETSRE